MKGINYKKLKEDLDKARKDLSNAVDSTVKSFKALKRELESLEQYVVSEDKTDLTPPANPPIIKNH